MTRCEHCTGPGWCERHRVMKSQRWVELCQTRDDYFQAWEDGRGPGQHDTEGMQPAVRKPTLCGPGCHLHRLLSKLWIRDRVGCNCSKHAAEMDQWGPDECLLKMDTILEWMEKESAKRHLPFVRTVAHTLVRIAVWRARKELANVAA